MDNITFFLSKIIVSQNPLHKKFFADNKSLTGSIYDVYQSKSGLLWLGTDNGLASFDGKNLIFYSNNLSSGKAVSCILETAGGVIWCQNFSGEFFYIHNDSLLLDKLISKTSAFSLATVIEDSVIAFYKEGYANFYNTNSKKINKIKCPEPFLHSANIKKQCHVLKLISSGDNKIISIGLNLKKTSLLLY